MPFLKAFEWKDAEVSSSVPSAVLQWPSLEYLHFDSARTMSQIPIDFAAANKLQFVRFAKNGVTEIPDSLCDLGQMVIFQLYWESITALPDCIGAMNQLEVVLIDSCVFLRGVP